MVIAIRRLTASMLTRRILLVNLYDNTTVYGAVISCSTCPYCSFEPCASARGKFLEVIRTVRSLTVRLKDQTRSGSSYRCLLLYANRGMRCKPMCPIGNLPHIVSLLHQDGAQDLVICDIAGSNCIISGGRRISRRCHYQQRHIRVPMMTRMCFNFPGPLIARGFPCHMLTGGTDESDFDILTVNVNDLSVRLAYRRLLEVPMNPAAGRNSRV